MAMNFWTLVAIAALAAVASPLGGLIALWRKPTTLFMSVALGFASGVLLATIGFEMLPEARAMSSLPLACASFLLGFTGVYLLDLFVHRGVLVGQKADQEPQVERFYQEHRPRGKDVTVLAAGTGIEELIEGLSIGVGAAITPKLGLLIALAVVIDNLSEGLSVGEIIRSEPESGRGQGRRVLGWTGGIGAALFFSALAGWLLLRGLPVPILGSLFGIGAGGMFYLVVTDLVPEAEDRQYQQSAAVAMTAGFLTIFTLSDLSS